ncbi:MAG TPA: TetR/AcrR family transcriptional regulator [Planctomycetota bacterium]|jgi:AcrR family transcriptional regulator
MNKESFKQRRRDATAELLVEAAEKVMTRSGFEAVTMRDIAAQAGCAPGTLYQYFENKQDLLNAILEKHTTVIVRRIDEATATSSDPVEQLQKNVRCSIEYIHEHRAVSRLFHTSVPHKSADPLASFPEPARAQWERRRQEDLKTIRTGQSRGKIRRDFSPEMLEGYMTLILAGFFEQFSCQEDPPSVEDQFRIIWGFLSGGMGIR